MASGATSWTTARVSPVPLAPASDEHSPGPPHCAARGGLPGGRGLARRAGHRLLPPPVAVSASPCTGGLSPTRPGRFRRRHEGQHPACNPFPAVLAGARGGAPVLFGGGARGRGAERTPGQDGLPSGAVPRDRGGQALPARPHRPGRPRSQGPGENTFRRSGCRVLPALEPTPLRSGEPLPRRTSWPVWAGRGWPAWRIRPPPTRKTTMSAAAVTLPTAPTVLIVR